MKAAASKRQFPPMLISLDNALRYIYNTFRYCGLTVAIEFKHGGRTWRADTPEEAIALRKQLEEADDLAWIEKPPLESFNESIWTHDAVVDLLNGLGDPQHAFLRALYAGPATSGQIRRLLRLPSELALAGVLSGLSKQVKKTAFKPSDLYSVTVTWSGKEKTRTFELSKDFTRKAGELGWPEAWGEK